MTDHAHYARAYWRALRPPEDLQPDEWADANIMLPQESAAEPGPYRTSRTPYCRGVYRAMRMRNGIRRVTLVAGSQLGKSQLGLNWIFYLVSLNPCPILVVTPNLDDARDFSNRRIDKIAEESPVVAGLFGQSRGRKATDTKTNKEFPGGSLTLRGSNSPSGLASMPIEVVVLEERDRHSDSAGEEGDPGEIAIARLRTYPNAKIYENSTPTVEGKSRIWESYGLSYQHRYHVPCVACGELQELVWDQMRWGEDSESGEVEYECTYCQHRMVEADKAKFLRDRHDGGDARWVCVEEGLDPAHVGYHISSLYSPLGWFSWAEIVKQYEASKGNPLREQVFFNTVLGLPYAIPTERPDWEKIYGRREQYQQGVVPEGAYYLTAGVDVQDDRLEVEVVGWGPGQESWSVDYRIIQGDPYSPETWEKLEAYRCKEFRHELGGALSISTMFIDSGYATSEVYAYCRGKHPSQVMAVKGSASLDTPLARPKRIDFDYKGTTVPGGATLLRVGVNVVKAELYGWLMRPLPEEGEINPPGWCHFPQYGRDYFQQLCSETMVPRVKDGRTVWTFEKVQNRNEALDCRVYARAAAISARIDHWTPLKWRDLENRCKDAGDLLRSSQSARYASEPRTASGRRKGPNY